MPDVLHPPSGFDELFGLVSLGDDRFERVLASHDGRTFGGETLGCATLAAARTCPERPLHSLHALFLRPVPAERPIGLHVERVREGRRLAHRRVRVQVGDRLLCELLASFATPGEGARFQDLGVEPAPAPPETLPSEEEVARTEGWSEWVGGPFEWRWLGTPWRPGPGETSRYAAWVRPRLGLGDDPALHAAAVAYLSDFHSHWPVARKLGAHFEPFGFTSLDQVVWLHRPSPWRDWRLLVSACDVAHAGRALTRRWLHARDGALVASMAQEALIPA